MLRTLANQSFLIENREVNDTLLLVPSVFLMQNEVVEHLAQILLDGHLLLAETSLSLAIESLVLCLKLEKASVI